MRKLVATVVAGILITGMAVAGEHPGHEKAAEAQVAKITPQTTCPVMGGKIDKNQYVDHDGKRIYVCCQGCIGAVKKDPRKYIKKLQDDGVTVARIQTDCPVMGGKVNKDLYVDHGGKRIYVCCAGCIAKLTADPATYVEKLEAAGVALDPTPKNTEPKAEAHGERGGHEGHRH